MYDYREGKKRIEEIIKNDLEIIENNRLPKSENLTFDNSYYSWISSIFIDIRKSSNLFKNEENETISKIMKSFTSELIEIIRQNDCCREIGIRGDCVYSIYTTPRQEDFYDLFILSCYCNTYVLMLNEILKQNDFPKIKVGIGLGASRTLVIKAGRKHVGINDKIWIGDAVIDASNFSSIANNGFNDVILMSSTFYSNLIGHDENQKKFLKWKNTEYGACYGGNVVMTEFRDWIKRGMSD